MKPIQLFIDMLGTSRVTDVVICLPDHKSYEPYDDSPGHDKDGG